MAFGRIIGTMRAHGIMHGEEVFPQIRVPVVVPVLAEQDVCQELLIPT